MDITDRQRREAILQEVQSFAEAIVKTVREPLLVLDKDLHLKMVNQSFLGTSRASKAETEGRLLYELDNGPVGHPPSRDACWKTSFRSTRSGATVCPARAASSAT